MVKNKTAKSIYFLFLSLGIDLYKFFFLIKGVVPYIKDYISYLQVASPELPMSFPRPVFEDRYLNSGQTSGHYFKQDLLVAQKIFERKPKKHIDIGSRIDGFVAHVASFREIEVVDIREQNESVANIKFVQADITKMNPKYNNYADSVSSLHAIEHIGLGRYGDQIDPNGHIKAIKSIYKILKKGGVFYLSVPFGTPRIEFNAHRVFSLKQVLTIVRPFTIQAVHIIDDDNRLYTNLKLTRSEIEKNFDCDWGCVILELTKKDKDF